ncbi:MAG: hypothetical protein QM715_05895 [Nibricoccus sp.]
MRWSSRTLIAVVAFSAIAGILVGLKTAPASPSRPTRAQAARPAGSAVASLDQTTENLQTTGGSWNERWRNILSGTPTPARTRDLAALIEELAKTDPKRALELAAAETNWRLRDLLRNAALRGWASVEPIAAANHALTIRPEERRSAVEAVMQGAAANPPEAVKTALHLCKSDTEAAGDYGHYTIAALVDVGAFNEAVQFGNQIGTDKYPFLLKSAFFQWSRNQPQEALAAVDSIKDPLLKAQAYGEAISGWAWADGKSVAEYALTLPSGSSRNDVLTEALPRWVEKDPVAATEWINKHDSGPEFDAGIEAVANLQSLIQTRPANALELAGNISDPGRRSHAMRAIFRQWATTDVTAAKRYVDSTANATDRALLADELKDMSPN